MCKKQKEKQPILEGKMAPNGEGEVRTKREIKKKKRYSPSDYDATKSRRINVSKIQEFESFSRKEAFIMHIE